jgi:hypothetical protein
MRLELMERMRATPDRRAALMNDGLLHRLLDGGSELQVRERRELLALLRSSTVILAPAERFDRAALAMQEYGVLVEEQRNEPEAFRWYRLHSLCHGDDQQHRPARQARQALTLFRSESLTDGTRMWLSEMEPRHLWHSFSPPGLNETWNGEPLVLNGVRYPLGIGAHANCRMTFDVPATAHLFQAVVGLSDGVRYCSKAAVTFEVRNDQGEILYESGVMDLTTLPEQVSVPLEGTSFIELVVTDAGNGRDCDHANWAMAAFVTSQ